MHVGVHIPKPVGPDQAPDSDQGGGSDQADQHGVSWVLIQTRSRA